jgi:hypothetical protein
MPGVRRTRTWIAVGEPDDRRAWKDGHALLPLADRETGHAHNKDFITAQGIQDAFRDGERCAR